MPRKPYGSTPGDDLVTSTGDHKYTGSAATASIGAAGAPPAQVAGYLTADLNGVTIKIPYYSV